MGLSDFIKTVKKIFTGDDGEYEDDYRFKGNDEYEETYDVDSSTYDDDDVVIPDPLEKKYLKALERLYSKLSEKELNDEDLEDMLHAVESDFYEGKIPNPADAINQTYQTWKSTKAERTQQKKNNRGVIINLLSRYDELNEDEKNELTDSCSKYSISRLEYSDKQVVTDIIQSWYKNRSLTEEKMRIINDLGCKWNYFDPDPHNLHDIPLTEEDYNQRLLIFNNLYHDSHYDDYYHDYALYFQKYWLESGNFPKPVKCDDLIINRPCYLTFRVDLVTPHFHMGKRNFEKECFHEVKIYLFEDTLEYLADRGHYCIKLTDIIEASINDWDRIRSERNSLSERELLGKEILDSEWPEPELFEITCRNGNKTLFSPGSWSSNSDLLLLRALIYYFIKNPHGSQQNIQTANQQQNIQQLKQQETMSNDSKIFFKPWVGSEYYSGGVYGKKVLVLGESHYGDTPDTIEETIGTIKEFVYDYWGAPYQQTFLCFERALAGREINQNEREQLWNSIMFYNFFQKSTTGPRTAPDMVAQKESEEAFRELLEQYQPDAIIVWGVRLYELLPGWDGTETLIQIENESTRVWKYNIIGKTIPAMSVHHPSAPTGKDWTYWHQFHKAFIGEPHFN